MGVTAREKVDPPRTRAQEVPSGIAGMRVIIVDSDERRAYEEAMRVKSMERTRQALEKLQLRIAAGKLKQPEKIGAAAERLLQRSHGYRYYSWEIHQGGLRYFENAAGLGSEKAIEGKYVIATSELGLSVLEVVAIYKDLSDVERGFRQLKDVLAMRPIYHQIEARVNAHIFVAALALLVQRLLDRRLEEAGINFSAERAMEALQTVRLVTFRMDDRPERRGVSGGCPDAPGPEGIEVDGFEAADTPRGGGNRDVVTIRKIESYPPRGYVDGPQTWANVLVLRRECQAPLVQGDETRDGDIRPADGAARAPQRRAASVHSAGLLLRLPLERPSRLDGVLARSHNPPDPGRQPAGRAHLGRHQRDPEAHGAARRLELFGDVSHCLAGRA